MNEHKELELKYLTNKDFKLARLLNLLTKNGFIILDIHDVINIDKYFDTPNKDLLKDGASLRIRIVNNKPYGTLKYPVNKDNNYCERIEIEKEIEEEHETMIEIEIKEGLNYKLLDNINDLIINNLGLIPTKENKYKRGLRLTTSKILSRKKHQ